MPGATLAEKILEGSKVEVIDESVMDAYSKGSGRKGSEGTWSGNHLVRASSLARSYQWLSDFKKSLISGIFSSRRTYA